jgi:acetyl-CoA carboxylase beta subunit
MKQKELEKEKWYKCPKCGKRTYAKGLCEDCIFVMNCG